MSEASNQKNKLENMLLGVEITIVGAAIISVPPLYTSESLVFTGVITVIIGALWTIISWRGDPHDP